jgi:formylglycine-generating enzyme required for sulfatase activity
LVIALVALIVFTMAACGSKNDLVGKWYTSQRDADEGGSTGLAYEFTSDGHLKVIGLSLITYKASDNTITTKILGFTTGTVTYNISGTELTISNGDLTTGLLDGTYYKNNTETKSKSVFGKAKNDNEPPDNEASGTISETGNSGGNPLTRFFKWLFGGSDSKPKVSKSNDSDTDDSSNDDGDSLSASTGNRTGSITTSTNGSLTITGIPSKYNGKYMMARAEEWWDDYPLFGADSFSGPMRNPIINFQRISGGSAVLKIWLVDHEAETIGSYSGNDSFVTFTVSIFDSPIQGDNSWPEPIDESSVNVNFERGRGTVSGPHWRHYIELVQIRPGTFTMGSPEDEDYRRPDETQYQVTLTKGFYMGKYEVTQAQYEAIMTYNISSFRADRYTGTSSITEGETYENRPVENVNWYDAIVFCNKLSMKEGFSPAYRINGSTNPDDWGEAPIYDEDPAKASWDTVQIVANSNGYRLPTEAQWEYACRAGTTTAYNTGDSISADTGWYDNSFNRTGGTHEVGLKLPNAWDLYDMHGNVSEWCWDWHGDYASGAQTDPMGASSGSYRVVRGGGWGSDKRYARSASRREFDLSDPAGRNSGLGFRLVRP